MLDIEQFLGYARPQKSKFFEEYHRFFHEPVCPALEGNWEKLLNNATSFNCGIMTNGRFVIASVATLPVVCLYDWLPAVSREVEIQLPVVIKNPLADERVEQRVGKQNALFEYGEALFAGVLDGSRVWCVRPVVPWEQETLMQLFRELRMQLPRGLVGRQIWYPQGPGSGIGG